MKNVQNISYSMQDQTNNNHINVNGPPIM